VDGLAAQIEEAVAYIRTKWTPEAKAGMILGTGLGGLTEQIEVEATLAYEDIPHFPTSTAPSHKGQLVCGMLAGLPVVTLEGRFHYYEGYSLREATFPVRVMKALGADTLVVTSAVGGMNPQYELADIIIIEDHINLMPDNPLRGVNDDSLGPRFPDMSAPYDPQLVAAAREAALNLSIPAHKGVLVAVAGPNLETRAEYRMLRTLGADIVGMSTVPEVIVARHASMRAVAFSVVTDMCLPDALEEADIDQIIEVAGRGGARLCKLIPEVLKSV
jgi:purine-nucleoside phosphorylase